MKKTVAFILVSVILCMMFTSCSNLLQGLMPSQPGSSEAETASLPMRKSASSVPDAVGAPASSEVSSPPAEPESEEPAEDLLANDFSMMMGIWESPHSSSGEDYVWVYKFEDTPNGPLLYLMVCLRNGPAVFGFTGKYKEAERNVISVALEGNDNATMQAFHAADVKVGVEKPVDYTGTDKVVFTLLEVENLESDEFSKTFSEIVGVPMDFTRA